MKISCRQMGLDCDFVADGDTSDEVKQVLLNHGLAYHMGYLMGLSKSQQQALLRKADEILGKQ